MDPVNTAAESMDYSSPAVRPQPAPDNLCLHQLIEEQARRTPELTALVFEDQRLSYGELNGRADQLACHLRELGISPEARVGMLLERSAATVIGILGILKAGAAYVPIDARYPQARIGYILEDAGAKVVLTDGMAVAKLPGDTVQAVRMDSFEWTPGKSPADIGALPKPQNLAYVIYTSGSTGQPKGVCVEHRNIVSYALAVAQRLKLRPGMSYAHVSTIAADLGNTVIFPALITGGCLHILSQQRTENPALLSEYFDRENIDVLKIAPSHLTALQSGKNPERAMPKACLILGGEPTSVKYAGRLRALRPECALYNHYGPTETTVGVLMYRVGDRLPDTPSGMLPLGTSLPNSRVHLLAADGKPAATGDRGEIHIGGQGVARGYLNRPELSASHFVPDPFDADPAARLYRTGDFGRRLPDGTIEYCGRIDNQVKVSGYRVALEEVDQALKDVPGVRDAVTAARDGASGGLQLIGHIIPQRASQPLWEFPAIHLLPDGTPVAHVNRNETDYIYNEIFSLQAYLRHGISIRDGACIVDAGANIGLFTVFASRLARHLRIVAFEPNPTAFACLKANAQAWGEAVTCLPYGLSDAQRVAEFTAYDGFSLLSGLYVDSAAEQAVIETYVKNQQSPSPQNEETLAQIGQLISERLRTKTFSAQLTTLSDIIKEHALERIDLLKINVEKSELDVLRGIGASDWPKIRQIVIEVDRRDNLDPIVRLLQGNGFDFLVVQDPLLKNTELRYVYAVRPVEGCSIVRDMPADGHLRPVPPPAVEILTPGLLRHRLLERLPRYMVPQSFVLTERFPLMPNGKVDRQALPSFSDGRKQAPESDHALSSTERALAAIWSQLLQVDHVAPGDDFFELGGHSMLAVEMVCRIEDTFDVDVDLSSLFEYTTLGALAGVVDDLLAHRMPSPNASPSSVSPGGPYIAPS